MDDKHKNPNDQGDLVSEAATKRKKAQSDVANDLAKAEKRGRGIALPEQLITDVLADVSRGLTLYVSCQQRGIDHAGILCRARNDEAFAERLRMARVDSTLSRIDRAELIAAGVEGFSSGDVKRDALMIKTIQIVGKVYAPELFAERVQHRVEHTVAPVIFPTLDQFSSAIDAEFSDVPQIEDAGDDGE